MPYYAKPELLDGDVAAGPNDLLIALDGQDEVSLAAALEHAEQALNTRPTLSGGGPRREPPRSLQMGFEEMPAANLALISTPGDYATAEALKALRLGLNVMLFSDNVPIADEIVSETLRRKARTAGDGSGLRHRDYLRHSARFCQRRSARSISVWSAHPAPDCSRSPA